MPQGDGATRFLLFALVICLSGPAWGEASAATAVPVPAPPAAANPVAAPSAAATPGVAPSAAAAPAPAAPFSAPAAATPAPAAPASGPASPGGPAAATGGPASAAKALPVILPMPAPLPAVLGGKIQFAEKAFPIVADQKEGAVQAALRKAAPAPCAACRGTGMAVRTGVCKPPPGVIGRPMAKTWEEDCPACGGYKGVYDARFGQRLVELVDALGHLPRDGLFATLQKSAEERLAAALEIREKTLVTFRCNPAVSETPHAGSSFMGGQREDTVRTMTGVDLVPGPSTPYRVDVPAMLEPLWARTGMSAPTGQGVFLIGTVGDRAEVAGWVVVRLEPAKGLAAIVLFSASEGRAPSAGKVAVGGLLVGRWTPEGGGSETPAAAAPKTALPPDPKAAGAPPPAAPKTAGAPPRASFGPNPALPVVLVVAAAAASDGIR